MPDQRKKEFYGVNYDREEIRSKIEPYSFNEARRRRGPIYEVLLIELYEKGHVITAARFKQIFAKEKKLCDDQIIRTQLLHFPKMLTELFEVFRESEISLNDGVPTEDSFRLLYEGLALVEAYEHHFGWLLEHCFLIICNICNKHPKEDNFAAKWIARIYFRRGLCHASKGTTSEMEIGMGYYRTCHKMARENSWVCEEPFLQVNPKNLAGRRSIPRGTSDEPLHVIVVICLVDLLFRYGKLWFDKSVKFAIAMGRRAIVLLAEIGPNSYPYRYFRANLELVDLILAKKEYKSALVLIEKMRAFIPPEGEEDKDYLALYCDFYIKKGICHERRPDGDGVEALRNYRKALNYSRQHKLVASEAKVLMQMGYLFAKKRDGRELARLGFRLANKIFEKLGDRENAKKSRFLTARGQQQEIFSNLVNMIKSTESHYCPLFKLRHWKQNKTPFWDKIWMELERQDADQIYCLLEEDLFTDPALKASVKEVPGEETGESIIRI